MRNKLIIVAGLAVVVLFPLAANASEVTVQDIWPAGPNSSEMNLYVDQSGAAPGVMEYLYGDDFTRLDDSSVIEWIGTGGTVGVDAVYAGAQQNLYTAGLTGAPTSWIISPPGTIGGTPAIFLESTSFTPVANPFLFLDVANGNNTYSNPSLNTNPSLQNGVGMVAFEVTGYLTTPGDDAGGYTLFSNPTYVIAFEDGSDLDYNDLVLQVTGVAPVVPVPAPNVPDSGTTVSLLGLALGACGMFARKMKKLV